ncbi:MAG: TaqI-like C-terminal specificity domain-containing protein [Chitinophagaceae bacterium]
MTGKTLIAQYIPYTSYCNTLLFILKLKPNIALITYKALLGILNSKFIGWYFRKEFQITGEDTFPQIMIRDIQQFAVPNKRTKITFNIESKVEHILSIKGSNSQSDTTSLENQIDQLVYQLYDLTEEEIKIIENT